MKVTVKNYHAIAIWKWNLSQRTNPSGDANMNDGDEQEEEEEDDDVCGICRVAFDGCCPDCKVPGDDCPLIWGECTHVFHMHCLLKWTSTSASNNQCPMDRKTWVTAGAAQPPPTT